MSIYDETIELINEREALNDEMDGIVLFHDMQEYNGG